MPWSLRRSGDKLEAVPAVTVSRAPLVPLGRVRVPVRARDVDRLDRERLHVLHDDDAVRDRLALPLQAALAELGAAGAAVALKIDRVEQHRVESTPLHGQGRWLR